MFKNHTNYNCTVTLDDQTQYKIYANWMHNNQLDQFQDWHCEAGATRIWIDKNLNVWSGECANDHLGDMHTDWNLLPKPTTCQRKTCTGCTDDLLTKKWKQVPV